MKTKFLIMLFFLVLVATNTWASSPPWTGSGHYTFTSADPYFVEGIAQDTSTVDILSGSFNDLHCWGNCTINMSGGTGNVLSVGEQSVLNLTGGNLTYLQIYGSAQINCYIQDYTFTPHYTDWDRLTGHWGSGQNFDILIYEGSFNHFTMHTIPEPCSVALLSLGALMLKKRWV
jgi:hypothetical protein